jgi:hypothetical protein
MAKTTGTILFLAGAVFLALFSGAMLFSSILLAGNPELTAASAILEDWVASAYISFWGFILAGAALSLLWMFVLRGADILRIIFYFFLIPIPLLAIIFNTVLNGSRWMLPVYDALRSWSGVSLGGLSPWTVVVALLIIHQIWKLGVDISLDEENLLFFIVRAAFNILIPTAFIPMMIFFGWGQQPPQFGEGMFFAVNMLLYIMYLGYRSNMVEGSIIRLVIFNIGFGMLVICLYAYLNSAAFAWLYDRLTGNPLYWVIIIAAYGGLGYAGTFSGRDAGGNKVRVHVYRQVSAGEKKSFWIFAAIALVVFSLMAARGKLSPGAFIENAQESLTNPNSARTAAAVNRIRRQNFQNADTIAPEVLAEKKAAIDEFIKNGASYRAEGELLYVYDWSDSRKRFTTEFEMFYNAETGVRHFKIESKDLGYRDSADEHLAPFFIPSGNYYIVNEGGATLALSEIDGNKKASPPGEVKKMYDLLMRICMENAIDTAFITSERAADPNRNLRLNEAHEYYRHYHDDELAPYYTRYELRTCESIPARYVFYQCDKTTKLTRDFTFDFYYDRIPDDIPSVSEYR